MSWTRLNSGKCYDMQRCPSTQIFSIATLACLLHVATPAAATQETTAEAASIDATAPRKPLLVFRRDDKPAAEPTSQYAAAVDSLKSVPAVDSETAPAPATVAASAGPRPAEVDSHDNRLLSPMAGTGPNDAVDRSPGTFELPEKAKQMLMTSGAGLAIVVGLLLACLWLVRRGGSAGSDLLPDEALTVLGKATLFGQTACHLVRLGNKLVLIAVTGDRLQPLVEVNDPEEVDRLMGLCLASRSHSSAAEFQAVLRQLAREPTQGFLGEPAGSRA